MVKNTDATNFTHAWCCDCGYIVQIEFDSIGIPDQRGLTNATDIMGKECRHVITTVYTDAKMISATKIELLTAEEKIRILALAENLWGALQNNNIGGYSGINRPLYIESYFRTVIEEYGGRDVGQKHTRLELIELGLLKP